MKKPKTKTRSKKLKKTPIKLIIISIVPKETNFAKLLHWIIRFVGRIKIKTLRVFVKILFFFFFTVIGFT